jgi:short-subunit dehydrogenase
LLGRSTTKAQTVVINGRSRERINRAAAAIGPGADGVVADLLTAEGDESARRLRRRASAGFLFVNNIGVFDANDFFEISDERWIEYFQQNIMTVVRITRIVMKEMLARNDRSIIFISSEAAIRSIGNMVPYSVTKTALLGLGRSLAELTRGTAVRVNSYMPGTTATESVAPHFADLAAQ